MNEVTVTLTHEQLHFLNYRVRWIKGNLEKALHDPNCIYMGSKVRESYENDIVMCDSLIETLPRVCSYDKK